jgi:uncharacterized damage-inducible protein DinB
MDIRVHTSADTQPDLGQPVFEATPMFALVALLDDTAGVVAGLSDETYAERLFAAVSGSIGEHVRHLLDHVSAFTTALTGGVVSYDHRRRGTRIEHDRLAALHAIDELKALLLDRPCDLEAHLVVRYMPSRTHEATCRSTVGRELAFVLSHTIHHQALIAVLAAAGGQLSPNAFGVAPSTPWPAAPAACTQ